MKITLFAALAFGLLEFCGQQAHAALILNEVFVNPPGTDNTQEFFEIKSTTGGVESMAGLHLLIIEGEAGLTTGALDAAFDLGNFSTGTNGIFLWQANTAVSSFSPAPNPNSTVNTSDFAPDLENGAQTYVLVRGYNGTMIGTDLDTNNDGVLDVTPWTSVVDALGVNDPDAGNVLYGAALGFVNFPQLPSGFEAEVVARLNLQNSWIASDISGTNPGGPYTFDAAETMFTDGSSVNIAHLNFDKVSPGSVNPSLIPEPASMVILGLAGIGALVWRRR